MKQNFPQRGFAPVLILVIVVILSAGGFVAYKELPKLISRQSSDLSVADITQEPESSEVAPSENSTQPITSQAVPTTKPKPTPTPTPAPVLHTVSVGGFAYDDRNDNGIYDSNDAKIPYMELRFYDSTKLNEWIGTTYSENDGNFVYNLSVYGNLLLKPNAGNGFSPRDNSSKTYSKDTSGISIGFRSSSAPVTGNSGVIEGDTYNDTNRNNARDSGEETVFFYKLYLQDSDGNYYDVVPDSWGGGHFKYINLPLNKTYKLWLSPASSYQVNRTEYNYTLTGSNPTVSDTQIPVVKVNDY
ncbi:MAG: hypothetical protein AAB599_00990 [Patescibacteria group bacterium]